MGYAPARLAVMSPSGREQPRNRFQMGKNRPAKGCGHLSHPCRNHLLHRANPLFCWIWCGAPIALRMFFRSSARRWLIAPRPVFHARPTRRIGTRRRAQLTNCRLLSL